MKIECIDIGGTSLRWALIENEKIIHHSVFKTPPFSELEKFIPQTITAMRNAFPDFLPDVSVMGLPGPVNGNKLLASAPLKIKEPVDLFKWNDFFSNSLFIENDLNLAVRAEMVRGAGKNWKNFYLLTLSTGIGSGIVLDEKSLLGSVGEFGHSVLDGSPTAPLCDCGHRGCWSAFSSGAGIVDHVLEKTGMKMTTEEAFTKANDPKINEIISEARRKNAHGMGMMLNALPMEGIVIMGSVGLNQFSRIIPTAGEIRPFCVNPIVPIIPTSLGDEIGIWGAYEFGVRFAK